MSKLSFFVFAAGAAIVMFTIVGDVLKVISHDAAFVVSICAVYATSIFAIAHDIRWRTPVGAVELPQKKIDPSKTLSPGKPFEAFGWLIERPGHEYLSARECGGYEFFWTHEHLRATRFHSRHQADMVMMAVRQLNPKLFPIGIDVKPIEHVWLMQG